jgi:hypothetical protein
VYAAAAPLIICGAAVAANAAAREDWPRLGVAMAMIAVGAGRAYAGPIGVWAIAGVGCCMVLLGCAVAQADHVHIVGPGRFGGLAVAVDARAALGGLSSGAVDDC